VAQAFVAHGLVLNGVDIRDVGKPDAAANQFGAAEADGVMPHLFQERGGIARRASAASRVFSPPAPGSVPRRCSTAPEYRSGAARGGGGIANAQMPRQAAEVQQQVADGGADIKANRAK
jgi:hypothetical protein